MSSPFRGETDRGFFQRWFFACLWKVGGFETGLVLLMSFLVFWGVERERDVRVELARGSEFESGSRDGDCVLGIGLSGDVSASYSFTRRDAQASRSPTSLEWLSSLA
jgi:hypothetical protein